MNQPMHEVKESRTNLLKNTNKNKNEIEIESWTFCFLSEIKYPLEGSVMTGLQWCQFFKKIYLSSWDLERPLKQNYLSKLIWAQAKVCYLLMRKPADGDCHFEKEKKTFRGCSKWETDSNTYCINDLSYILLGQNTWQEQLKGRGVCFSLQLEGTVHQNQGRYGGCWSHSWEPEKEMKAVA